MQQFGISGVQGPQSTPNPAAFCRSALEFSVERAGLYWFRLFVLWSAVETFSRLLQQAIGSTEASGAAGGGDTEMTEEEVGHNPSRFVQLLDCDKPPC